jgi:hypothetical protein
MSRTINIADTKGRNSEVVFSGQSKKQVIMQTGPTGEPVKSIRILKVPAENSINALMAKYGDADSLSKALIESDPEINLLMTGRIIEWSGRIIVNQQNKPVTHIQRTEKVFLPDGNLKEERQPKETVANILNEYPIKGSRYILKKEAAKKFVFAKKYQLLHSNGLTFDFLYNIAEELQEKKSLLMLGAGIKSNEPLVFQDGGKSYRVFLEGRISEGKYLLLLHLSNLELKGIG